MDLSSIVISFAWANGTGFGAIRTLVMPRSLLQFLHSADHALEDLEHADDIDEDEHGQNRARHNGRDSSDRTQQREHGVAQVVDHDARDDGVGVAEPVVLVERRIVLVVVHVPAVHQDPRDLVGGEHGDNRGEHDEETSIVLHFFCSFPDVVFWVSGLGAARPERADEVADLVESRREKRSHDAFVPELERRRVVLEGVHARHREEAHHDEDGSRRVSFLPGDFAARRHANVLLHANEHEESPDQRDEEQPAEDEGEGAGEERSQNLKRGVDSENQGAAHQGDGEVSESAESAVLGLSGVAHLFAFPFDVLERVSQNTLTRPVKMRSMMRLPPMRSSQKMAQNGTLAKMAAMPPSSPANSTEAETP